MFVNLEDTQQRIIKKIMDELEKIISSELEKYEEAKSICINAINKSGEKEC